MSEAELDHIASGIRPSWELDDAPFRPGGLASPDLEALLAVGISLGASGNGVSHSHTNGAASAITAQRVVSLNGVEREDMLTRVDPVPPTHVLEQAPIAPVRVEPAPAAPLPVPHQATQQAPQQFVSQAASQSNRPPPPSVRPPPVQVAPSRPPTNGVSVSAQADPFAAPEKSKPKAARAKSTSSADFPAIQKSNKGLYIALGGGAVLAVIAIIAFSSSGKSDAAKVSASPTATQMPGASTTHEIPPPPATDDLPAATAQAATAQPTQTAAPTTTQVADLPTATTAPVTAPAPTATHASHADTSPAPTHHSSPPAHANPPASGGSGKGKGGIVRDVPF